ncbi:MAG: 2-amino-4,5-dihydroxy-6-one-heptanoic acid-7-phosphate synthase [Pseudonocardia sp.]|nr:2-amino-4,5-dihydroxy-6-one-heptanoic acid-7-phosphate synthase [Pseudonocardia sp.]
MLHNDTFARRLRLQRLYHADDEHLFIVPLDHSITNGPIIAGAKLDTLVGQLTGNGVDAVVLHKGCLRHIQPRWFADTSLIVHLSASTTHAPDPDAKYLVASVEEAVRLGADGVSVHVNVGSDDEMRQIGDLATVAEACDRWSVPLLAMMYPRGPKIEDPKDPLVVAHAVSIAADLGADVVKTVYTGSVAEMAQVTRDCAVPIIAAGGARMASGQEVTSYVCDVLRAGAVGVAMGRNIFEATDPGAMARRVAGVLHSGPAGISELAAAG